MGLLEGRLLDARPDRVDFRDRPYLPPLRPLPPVYPVREQIDDYFAAYAQTFVLDQHKEGACTGFGLAAVINFMYWQPRLKGEARPEGAAAPVRVSPRMLYELARLYDEWDGEDYEGSSCRGAMKGWHKHGVCSDALWPYGKRFLPPKEGWAVDAVERPLGAYYRVDAKSLNDMQAAIFECGAIYASARIHEGWKLENITSIESAVIPQRTGDFIGGHAFALVGYDRRGFIVQNSWGTRWGYSGFARLTYADWIEGGFDAWVAASGAPVAVEQAPAAFSPISLQAGATETVRITGAAESGATTRRLWKNEECYEHAIVLGNDGAPLRRLIPTRTGAENLRHVLKTNVEKAYAEGGKRKLVLYLHGGLNDEEAGIARVAVLGPAFADNDIHPVFVVWRTGFGETIANIVGDVFPKQQERVQETAKGFGKAVLNWLDEQKDATIELAARIGGGKAVWTEMKENAEFSGEAKGGMGLVADVLAELAQAHKDLTVHVVAHSAGAILLGHLLRRLGKAKSVRITTTTLYAPAATVQFAADHYGPAFEAGTLPKSSLLVHVLDDRIEVDDTVFVYGKSLLYLVSRAFERDIGTPLLGLQLAWKRWWDKARKGQVFNAIFDPEKKSSPLVKWEALVQKHKIGQAVLTDPEVVTGPGHTLKPAHGTFDNDVKIVNATLARILGKAPARPVTDLTGF